MKAYKGKRLSGPQWTFLTSIFCPNDGPDQMLECPSNEARTARSLHKRGLVLFSKGAEPHMGCHAFKAGLSAQGYVLMSEAYPNPAARKEQGAMTIETWFRTSTSEWVGEVSYSANGTSGIYRATGETEKEAKNAAFAVIPRLMLEAHSEVDW